MISRVWDKFLGENKMAREVNWDSLIDKESRKGSSSGSKTNFLKLEGGKTYTVRPVGTPCEFFKFFAKTAKGNRSVCVEVEDVDKASDLLSKALGKDIKPQHRYAINIIDMDDSNKVKILENGAKIFRAFGVWSKSTKKLIGGKDAWIWTIHATGDGLERDYNAFPVNAAPLDPKEVERVKAEHYNLSEIYKGVPLDQVVAKITGDKVPEDPETSNNLPKGAVASEINF